MNSHLRWICLLLLTVILQPAARAADDAPQQQTQTQWYKGNLHTHSLWSDGNDFPEMICDWYAKHGYHFLALSDHNILSEGEKWIDVDLAARRGAIGGFQRYLQRFGRPWIETRQTDGTEQVRLKPLNEFRSLFEQPGRFLLIQGEEITDHFGSKPIHLNASNLQDLIKPQGGDSVRETIANNLIAVQRQSERIGRPILAHLNHPNFGYAVTAEDMAAVIQERFFEVYNGHPGVNHLGDEQHAPVEQMWDIANTIRVAEMQHAPLFGLATDDSHNYFGERGSSPGRGWVMVRASHLTPESIVTAITRGDFYASSGVELNNIRYLDKQGVLELEIAARPNANYVTEFIGTLEDYDRASEPVVDADGKEIAATRRYSKDVGKVLARVEGPNPRYQLTGNELYVRAVVTSSEPADNPSYEGQTKQAWTQPVGWESRVQAAASE